MSFGDSFMKMIGIDDNDADDISEEEIEKEKERIAKQQRKGKAAESAPAPAPAPTPAPAPAPAPERPVASTPAPAASTKPQNYGRPERRFTVTGTNTSQFKLVLIEPRTFDECPKLVDSLKSKKPVIINLERLDTDMAKKIFDFLSGATYALDGNVQKVANNIFIFAPANVGIAGGIREDEEPGVTMEQTNSTGFGFNRDEPTLTAENPWGVR